ncbi:MAG: long-chain fatty acid--CoA ligase [Rhodobacteraceae bacterium]|nr:long-chain fatty acid--CoA ligase [Paracoccaceae bacterium]
MSVIFDITAKRADLSPDALAMRDVVSGEEITYQTLEDRANRVAAALERAGLKAGQRVGILTHNNTAFFEILFACAKARIILVPLNWRLTVPELLPLLEDSDINVMIHDVNCSDLAKDAAAVRSLTLVPIQPHGEQPVAGSYQSMRTEPQGDRMRDPAWPADDTWYMIYTSGTTGVPKAVPQTFGMAMSNYLNLTQALDISARSRSPNFLPLFHTAGINLHTLPILIAGGTVDVLPGFDPELFMSVLQEGKTTTLFAVPAVFQALRTHPKFNEIDFTKIPSWGSGGAALPDAVVQEFLSKGVRICQGWGMTETGPSILFQTPNDAETKLGSVGRPLMLSEAKIVDESGKRVAVGDTGELLVRGPLITPGYRNRPEANAETFLEGGWMRTGDVARQDEDGCFYLVDRIKDMYISGGENVYPAEVENTLAHHPDILEAAVLGVADEQWGEVGCACVIPKPGHTPVEADVIAFCKDRLAGYKIPKSVKIMEDFPRTPAGKTRKHLLRDMLV